MNISVKRLAGSSSSFKAQENGNSWSIFNIFRHLHVYVALVTMLMVRDDVDAKEAIRSTAQ